VSKYEEKLAKIADLKKQAESERKAEVVRILEKYCGKIKDLQAFETSIKPCATAIKYHQQQNKTTDDFTIAEENDHLITLGGIAEEVVGGINSYDAWRSYLKKYADYIRKTQEKP